MSIIDHQSSVTGVVQTVVTDTSTGVSHRSGVVYDVFEPAPVQTHIVDENTGASNNTDPFHTFVVQNALLMTAEEAQKVDWWALFQQAQEKIDPMMQVQTDETSNDQQTPVDESTIQLQPDIQKENQMSNETATPAAEATQQAAHAAANATAASAEAMTQSAEALKQSAKAMTAAAGGEKKEKSSWVKTTAKVTAGVAALAGMAYGGFLLKKKYFG